MKSCCRKGEGANWTYYFVLLFAFFGFGLVPMIYFGDFILETRKIFGQILAAHTVAFYELRGMVSRVIPGISSPDYFPG